MRSKDKADIQWILNALANDATKTRKGVGEAINVDKSAVTRLLKGERALKLRESVMIADYLGVAPPIGFAEEVAAFSPPPQSSLAPVFKTIAMDDSPATMRLFRNEAPIDFRLKAPHFAAAALVFGLYIQDNAMAPRFKPGELIFADPVRPAASGDDVLFLARRAGKGAERALIAEMVSASPTHFEILQHGKKGSFRLSAKTWDPHPVLRCY